MCRIWHDAAMRHLLRLDDWNTDDLGALFSLARRFEDGRGPRGEGCAAMFFPPTSLRTRLSFERGAALMGLQPVQFPPDALDKAESTADVAGYIAQFSDLVVVRHGDIDVLDRMADAKQIPVINAMTDQNHPCEVLSDLYALDRGDTRDLRSLRFVFIGADGNIARAWAEGSRAFHLDLTQCCPVDLAVPGLAHDEDPVHAITGADVVITDGPGPFEDRLAPYRVTADLLSHAAEDVRLVPCPPFVRGREVSADAIDSTAFVGYGFKRALLPVQQAIMARSLGWVDSPAQVFTA